jgi:hypothetical protein
LSYGQWKENHLPVSVPVEQVDIQVNPLVDIRRKVCQLCTYVDELKRARCIGKAENRLIYVAELN